MCLINFYITQVKALNTKGNSEYSNSITATTKVSKIPAPLQVTFDPQTKILGVNIGQTCLALIAVVESVIHGDTPMAAWRIVETIPLQASGSSATFKQTKIEHLNTMRRNNVGRSLNDEEDMPMALEDDLNPRVRVKLCLRVNHEHCGDYTEADSKQYLKI